MKAVVFVTGVWCTLVAACGQGQVTFSNFSTADGLNCKAVNWGTTTGVTSPPYTAQLLRVNNGVETPVGAPVNFRPQVAAAGYLIPTVFTIDDVPIGGTASFRMVVLAGNVYSEAAVRGVSSVSTVTLGGGTITPPPLLGLTSITGNEYIDVAPVPEPSSMGIVTLGGAILAFTFHRRRRSD